MRSVRSIDVARFAAAPCCLLTAVLVFSFLSPTYLTLGNLSNVVAQACILALFAVGQTFAIVTRGFDISVGAVAALSGTVAALVANTIGLPGLLVAPLVGMLVGTVTGFLVGTLRIQSIIATLGMMIAVRSLALLITQDGQAVVLNDAALAASLSFDPVFGLPPIYWGALAVIALGAWILHRSVVGRRLVMLGSNPEAAGLVGIRTAQVHRRAYQLCGLFAGFAGLLITLRAGAGLPTEGAGVELQSIAAAVIGGTALSGGVANIWIVAIGAAFIQALLTGLNLMGISPYAAEIAVGVVIIASGLLEFAIRRYVHQRSKQGERYGSVFA